MTARFRFTMASTLACSAHFVASASSTPFFFQASVSLSMAASRCSRPMRQMSLIFETVSLSKFSITLAFCASAFLSISPADSSVSVPPAALYFSRSSSAFLSISRSAFSRSLPVTERILSLRLVSISRRCLSYLARISSRSAANFFSMRLRSAATSPSLASSACFRFSMSASSRSCADA